MTPAALRRPLTTISLVFTLALALVPALGSRAHAANPACVDVAIVLDESGSVGSHEAQVRAAASTFLGGLADQGPTGAIVEFGSRAVIAVDHTLITDASMSSTFDPYLATGYDSPSQTGAYTNWDDALAKVGQLNDTKVVPLVLFVTDGDPTAYNLDAAGEPGGVERGAGATAEALARAIDEAAAVEGQGSHLLAIGVGGAATADSRSRLEAIAGPNVYDGSGALDPFSHDVVLVPDFAQLQAVLSNVAMAMCADPAIDLTKSVDTAVILAGDTVTYTIEVTNTGNVDLHDVSVSDPSLPGCDAVIGDLAVGETATYQCSDQLLTSTTNVATATGDDPFGTTVSDTDSADIVVVADPDGTGTPGYWKNHPDAWVVLDGGLLIGDWNRNGTCDAGEACLAMTADEAMAALSTPPRGDSTYNVARPLVAAWLNIMTFNEASCIVDDVDAAVAWLLTNPVGSSPDRDAWGDIAETAKRLDDYNNGRLCAPSRDAAGNDGDGNGGSGPAAPTPPKATPQATTTTTAAPEQPDSPARPGEDHASDRRPDDPGAGRGRNDAPTTE